MTSADTLLHRAAQDGALDSAEWPKTLQYILDRLDQIINDFPKPPTNTPHPQNAISSQESHATDKENAPPATPPRPPVPAFTAPSESPDVPPETATFYASIRSTLSKNFAKHPPHTVQRLAELVLEPKKRYKFLSPYLRALDRVVSVSSPLTIFPLPQAVLPTTGGLLNGTTSAPSQASTLGSDESLGGALLTPIPWLQNRGQSELISESTEIVDGPNGAGRIETVTVGMLSANPRAESPSSTQVAQIASSHPDGETLPSTGPVTQGELLRQEQEAGIVLNNPHSMTKDSTRAAFGELEGGASVVETVENEDEIPHARGPEKIGMEDTGPQKEGAALDIEGAIGRPSVEGTGKGTGLAIVGDKGDADMKDGDDKSETKAETEKKDAGQDKEDVEMKSDN
ncbi:hypothetical protein P153DRAFT_387171 [Dothidotthia symphoricarpi CBS 119687]|uniref:PPP4R2-domain-containing protein n=1 Tax=Dothidotthia symphoricarpi CBS 119687 TaxID=1392245 RepID=A0A6A6A9I6_9PLEO|nr:uncharacterized protein P153DRAFT_387171 [Dothidotthia symphoricarpi CBS 119687]KAF2128216.1 hypothetical protein P153DRAFT_387171 [Dothidotthia symphoricarpi CBS 119687]